MDLAEIARRLELETLYTDYAACLDSDALESWPEFFTEDCRYRVTSAENYEAGLPLGLIYATSQNMLRDRVSALRDANIYEPQRYRHLISNIRIGPPPHPPPLAGEGGVRVGGWDGRGPDVLEVTANFLVVRTMQDGAMCLFAAGRYVDRVARAEAGWKFAKKDVVLDSRQIDTLLAIPL
jgi:3-phenylpropionate/cinnamic acid dioxygenase small subunit